MPLLLSQRSVDTLIAHCKRNSNSYQQRVLIILEYTASLCFHAGRILFALTLRLIHSIYALSFEHFRVGGCLRRDSGSKGWSSTAGAITTTAYTVIAIEADEQQHECTPLLMNDGRRQLLQHNQANNNVIRSYGSNDKQQLEYVSCNNDGDNYNNNSSNSSLAATTKSTNSSSCYSSYHYEAKVHLCDFRLFAIFLLSFVAFIIAAYLLIAESRLPTLGFTLDLVNHDIWRKMAIPLASTSGLLNHTNVLNVLVLHTGGASCFSSNDCIRLLNEMQYYANPTEMPYNFLVGDDGETYEVRGWDHANGFTTALPQNTSIVIGFIGNYTDVMPNTVLLQSTLSLIKESVRRRKLKREYHIYGLRNITSGFNDAEALFKQIGKWPHFNTLLHVL